MREGGTTGWAGEETEGEVTDETGVFGCRECGARKVSELPPLWMGKDGWPTCCSTTMSLMHVGTEHAPKAKPRRRRKLRLPSCRAVPGTYLMLDLLSKKVPGPLSWLSIDDRVRLFARAGHLMTLSAHHGLTPFIS